MSQADVLLEGLQDVCEAVGEGIADYLGVERQELAFESERPCAVVDDDEELILRQFGDPHEFLPACLHADGDVVAVALFLEGEDVLCLEVRGDEVGGVRGRDEALALPVAAGLALFLLPARRFLLMEH
jgi:hypothetical protein